MESENEDENKEDKDVEKIYFRNYDRLMTYKMNNTLFKDEPKLQIKHNVIDLLEEELDKQNDKNP